MKIALDGSIKMQSLRLQAEARIIAMIADVTNPIVAGVPLEERLSWSSKAAAARAYLAGDFDAPNVAMIEVEAAAMGEHAADLAQKISAKAAAYENLQSRLTGLRRKAVQSVQEATIPAELRAAVDALRSDLSQPI